MSKLIERQVFVTWYTPEEKLPEDGIFVVATISGRVGNITYDHAMTIAEYYEGEGWVMPETEKITRMSDVDHITVNAWADLEPYWGS